LVKSEEHADNTQLPLGAFLKPGKGKKKNLVFLQYQSRHLQLPNLTSRRHHSLPYTHSQGLERHLERLVCVLQLPEIQNYNPKEGTKKSGKMLGEKKQ
jgi:hypothetical protein